MGICQVILITLICVTLGFIVGVWVADEYHIDGLKGLGSKVSDLFRKTAKAAENSINEKLVSPKTNWTLQDINK